MTNKQQKLLGLLKILSDESKYKIVLHLMKGEECVCNLAEDINIERSLVSHHLKTLKEAGLIADRKVGTWVHYSLSKEAFEELEKLYGEIISSKNISNKLCNSHEACRLLDNISL